MTTARFDKLVLGTNLTGTDNADGSITVDATGSGGTQGTEIGYDQITSNVAVSATSEASGTLVVQGSAYTFDGSPVIVEFFAPAADVGAAAGAGLILNLFEGSTHLARIIDYRHGSSDSASSNLPLTGRHRFTPSAASHTYKITGIRVGSTNANVYAGTGSGGAGTYMPTYLRFTKV